MSICVDGAPNAEFRCKVGFGFSGWRLSNYVIQNQNFGDDKKENSTNNFIFSFRNKLINKKLVKLIKFVFN